MHQSHRSAHMKACSSFQSQADAFADPGGPRPQLGDTVKVVNSPAGALPEHMAPLRDSNSSMTYAHAKVQVSTYSERNIARASTEPGGGPDFAASTGHAGVIFKPLEPSLAGQTICLPRSRFPDIGEDACGQRMKELEKMEELFQAGLIDEAEYKEEKKAILVKYGR